MSTLEYKAKKAMLEKPVGESVIFIKGSDGISRKLINFNRSNLEEKISEIKQFILENI